MLKYILLLKIGGGIHMQILLPAAQGLIGECTLLVAQNEYGKMILPRIETDRRYWAVFKAIKPSAADKSGGVFTTYKNGQGCSVTATQDQLGKVTVVTYTKSPSPKCAVFFDVDSEPVWLS